MDSTSQNVHLGDRKTKEIAISAASLDSEVGVVREQEHHAGVWETVRAYPKAVFWSMFFSLGVIMTGYDPQLMGNLLAVPKFQQDFGYLFEGSYIISAPWQTALLMGNPIGQVVGAFAATYPMEYFGRKKSFLACVAISTCFTFIQFFARSLTVLLVGELLGGLLLGTYIVIAPVYASEVCPLALRGVFTSYINLCFVTGQLIAAGITAGTQKLDNHWAYSAPFASQWFWPAIIFVAAWAAPESPYWLARHGREEAALRALHKLASPSVDVKPILATIIETDRLEQELEAGSRYIDCFRKINRRRTEIAVGVYSIQVISGIYLISYVTYFFQLAGLPTDKAFSMSVGFLAIGWVSTIFSWYLMTIFGRRTLFNFGLSFLIIILLLVGILDCIPGYDSKPGLAWTQSTLMLIWNFFYDFSVGPISFVILCEISATRIRSKTIAISTAVQAAFGIVMTIAIPYLINPAQANARGKIGFFFGGLASLALVWSYLRVPETAGRTYEELDIMFARDVKTRDFKNYKVE